MNIDDFISDLAAQFDDTDESIINADTQFADLDEWTSLMAMLVAGMVKNNYGKAITVNDVKACQTVGDLYNLIESK